MTASARETQLLKTARQILEEAGRPLSVRRILRAGEQDDRFEGQPDLEALREALLVGVSEGLVEQARRGIFTLASGEAEPAAAKTEPAPAKSEAPSRRRRRESPPGGSADTPKTLEEAAALSAGTDRDALKGKLWSRLQRKASQITDQPTTDAEAPAAPAGAKAESDPPAADEAPKGRRRRRRRESGEKRAREPQSADEKPRRRRRRPDSDASAVEANPAPASAEANAAAAPATDAADPRAKLKARLAGRSRPSTQTATAEAETPAPPAQAETPASDATDARSLLKRRLAARAGGSTETEAPTVTEAKPAAEPAEAPRARGRRRRRGPENGGARAALKARLSARATGDSAATTTEASAPTAQDEAVPAAAEAAASGGGGARARLKARLAARAGGDAEAPAAEPTKAAEAPTEAPAARDALKSRLAARTRGNRRPAKASTAAKPTPKAAPAPKGDTDPRAALKARLAGRRGTEPAAAASKAEAPKAKAAASKAPAASTDPRAALKARLGARRGADPLEVPLAESRRPYREKRQEDVAPKAERRSPSLPEVSPTSALVDAALDALRGSGAPLTIDALTDAVDGAADGGSIGLRAALRAENGRRELAGLRPLFVAHYGGSVGLTEWGLSERYSALEARIQEALAEQQELVRRDLLARVGDLTDAGFEQVIVMLLEQLGHRGVKVVHRQAGTVALTVSRGAEGGGSEKIAVVARKSWGPIKQGTVRRLRDTLAHFEADSGLVMTIGTFAASARSEARQDGLAHVRLIDGAGLAGLLYEHGIGLSSHRPVMRHLDVAFFASLEA